ncbi:hypothetical protein MKW98_032243 [Papaver atlanticum]|uniref:TF-B3 domain-containing protein n=1 Tax=Papaver atlanticum TaxID=357466 RepID=A0AAD4SFK6_9MAGN|nr:hypothetical protein MKW98_032243 [Papaver atlanticum]
MRKFVDSDRKYHFFKVLLEEDLTRMQIPEAFYPRLSKESQSSRRAVVQGPSGAHWVTTVSKSQDGIYLNKGWEVFVRENGLRMYDFLIFKYGGGMQFSVKVFTMHGVLREECFVPVRASLLLEERNDTNEDESDEEKSDEDESDEDKSNEDESYEDKPNEDESNEDESDEYNPNEEESDENEEEYVSRPDGVRRRSASASRSSSPFFSITVRRAYLEHNYLPIPWAVRRNYFHNGLKKVKIITSDASDDRAWRIRTLNLGADIRLSKGITDFLKKKNGLNLKVGDVCHFKVIKRRSHKLVLRVQVSRRQS